MAIGDQLEVQIAAARLAPREREWVADRPEVADPLAIERDDLDRLANGTRGVLRRIVVGDDPKAQ